MITLQVADLVVIASRTLRLNTGQVLDLLDSATAEFALAQARPGDDPGDPAGQAAVLLGALVRSQPLRRGNQQVALAAMLQFLALNGLEMESDPPGAVAALVAGLAVGTLDVKTVAERLAPRLRPAGRPAARVKEAPMPEHPVSLAMRIKNATMRTQPKGMFNRFTDRARLVVHLAQEEARLLRQDYVGSEHLLLGLLRDREGVGAQALTRLGADDAQVREQVLGLLRADSEQTGPRTQLAADLADTAERLTQVRRQKQAAFDAGDLDRAAALRDQDRQLVADQRRLENLLADRGDGRAIIAENQRLHRELDRLHGLLRQHGIDSDGGGAQTA